MKRLTVLLLVLVIAGCGGGEKWGGYTESEAKEIMASDSLRNSVVQTVPFDNNGRPYTQLLPTKTRLEQTDLLKSSVEGQDAWLYKDQVNAFCLYVWKDPETKSFTTFIGCS